MAPNSPVGRSGPWGHWQDQVGSVLPLSVVGGGEEERHVWGEEGGLGREAQVQLEVVKVEDNVDTSIHLGLVVTL